MSELSSISSQTTSPQNEAVTSQSMGKEEFLQLLVTQLSNQNPLNPMKNEEFVAQLATFSSLEQQIGTNERLDTLVLGQATENSTSAVNFIGKDVRALANWLEFDGQTPEAVNYELLDVAKEVTITITDSNGEEVNQITLGSQDAGNGYYVWDGTDKHGKAVDAGSYEINVEAVDIEGGNVEALEMIVGRVTGISYENGYAELLIGDRRISLGDIVEVLEE